MARRRTDAPDPDLELAVALVNTVDLLETPPDRLVEDADARHLLERAGHPTDAAAIRPGDVAHLRELRERLRSVFTAATPDAAVRLLNDWLAEVGAAPKLAPTDNGAWTLTIATDGHGVEALRVRLPAAVARFVARWGPARLGYCAADPCRCVYLDRTPAATRRYCCQWCTDRIAAAAYRRRAGTAEP